ncbi:hypothetical protein CBR_g23941 [Chara braunii]|uniref:PsbP C-terminal domain-containing protein n=1 Tax=Chara braunii TaxID=69332 RepID=A0A388L5B6_CHABU|nr:hypothetical protein CBR_g23941 [Chara braunii]|eukprot:GBG77496.1 hypothetical protein CBR_g23941 [Chara braunii]
MAQELRKAGRVSVPTAEEQGGGTGPEYDYPDTSADEVIPVVKGNEPIIDESTEDVAAAPGENLPEMSPEDIEKMEREEEGEEEEWTEDLAQNEPLPDEEYIQLPEEKEADLVNTDRKSTQTNLFNADSKSRRRIWMFTNEPSLVSADDRTRSLTTWRTFHPIVSPTPLMTAGKSHRRGGRGPCHVAARCKVEEEAADVAAASSRREVLGLLIASSVVGTTCGLPSPLPESAAGAKGVFLSMAMAAEDAEAADPTSFRVYFGNAAAAASYGGYGGNASKQSEAEYTYKVPATWKEHVVSKIEKGTNGTDSEFYNPKKRSEKVYLTYLGGVPKLGPKEAILNNLALSDVSLQDALAEAEEISTGERTDAQGQVYYDYEFSTAGEHSLITVTCKRNKLYSLFVRSPEKDFKRDESMLREIWSSFSTV